MQVEQVKQVYFAFF